MSRKIRFIRLMGYFLCSLSIPALAGIGQKDVSNSYSNVGFFFYQLDDQLVPWCSGVLIGQNVTVKIGSNQQRVDVFLTAGHGTAPFEPLRGSLGGSLKLLVTFRPDGYNADYSTDFIEAVDFRTDPHFGHDLGDYHDLGVLLLPPLSTAGIIPALLPAQGYLDQRAANGGLRGVNFERAGYGVVPEWKRGPMRISDDGWRRYTLSPFLALNQYFLRVLQNVDAIEEGMGGACAGDSGSPLFLDGKAVATVTGGDGQCRALNFNYRLDTDSAREFLGQFVSLP